jgi:HSP20 family molecular chaperone IbpA
MCAQWRVERRTIRVTAMGRMYEELPMGRKIMLSSVNGVWRPPTDVFESDHAYVIRVEISGLRQTAAGEIENAALLVEEDLIVLRGERSDDCPHLKCNYHQMEIQYGPFEVAIRIPAPFDHDAVTTKYRQGFLEIVAPKGHAAQRGSKRTKKGS